MKTIRNLLTKSQQKKILGGVKEQIVCTCTGDTNRNSTYACVTYSQSGTLDCYSKAADYCDGSLDCKTQQASAA